MMEIDIFTTFDRFKAHLPIGGDLTLMILKGHLLVEEQIWVLIRNRVAKSSALDEAELTSHQRICLADALIDDFTRDTRDAGWLWPTVKKLNKLRNDIAHELTPSGITDRVTDLVRRIPGAKLQDNNLCHEFELALWIICAEVHQMIEAVTPEDFDTHPKTTGASNR